MINDEKQKAAREAFPLLAADKAVFAALIARAALVNLNSGQTVCHQGSQCAQLPLMLAGTTRVFKLGENGREITLYRIRPGESCVLTASCILNDVAFPAIAVCEEDGEALVVPALEVVRWQTNSPSWRRFLFASVGSRLAEVIELVDEVVFRRMDQRLAEYLLRRADSSGMVHGTHQEIAADLGSSREVVTRILRDLEARDLLRTGRGVVLLLAPEELSAIYTSQR